MARRKMSWGKVALVGGAAVGGFYVLNKVFRGTAAASEPTEATKEAIKKQVEAKEEPANIVKTILQDSNVSQYVNEWGEKATSTVTGWLSKLGVDTSKINI